MRALMATTAGMADLRALRAAGMALLAAAEGITPRLAAPGPPAGTGPGGHHAPADPAGPRED